METDCLPFPLLSQPFTFSARLSLSPSCPAGPCLMPCPPPLAAACLSDPVLVSFRACLLVIKLHYLCCISCFTINSCNGTIETDSLDCHNSSETRQRLEIGLVLNGIYILPLLPLKPVYHPDIMMRFSSAFTIVCVCDYSSVLHNGQTVMRCTCAKVYSFFYSTVNASVL